LGRPKVENKLTFCKEEELNITIGKRELSLISEVETVNIRTKTLDTRSIRKKEKEQQMEEQEKKRVR